MVWDGNDGVTPEVEVLELMSDTLVLVLVLWGNWVTSGALLLVLWGNSVSAGLRELETSVRISPEIARLQNVKRKCNWGKKLSVSQNNTNFFGLRIGAFTLMFTNVLICFVNVDLFFIPSQNFPVYVFAHEHCTFPYPSNKQVPPFRQGWFSWHAVKDGYSAWRGWGGTRIGWLHAHIDVKILLDFVLFYILS